MMAVFICHEGVVHHQHSPPGQTITKAYYIEVLRQLRYAVRRKLPHLWASSNWQRHYNNAPALSTAIVQAFWQNITSPSSVPPTAHIWFHVTSGISQIYNRL
jgi:hypothetical protein